MNAAFWLLLLCWVFVTSATRTNFKISQKSSDTKTSSNKISSSDLNETAEKFLSFSSLVSTTDTTKYDDTTIKSTTDPSTQSSFLTTEKYSSPTEFSTEVTKNRIIDETSTTDKYTSPTEKYSSPTEFSTQVTKNGIIDETSTTDKYTSPTGSTIFSTEVTKNKIVDETSTTDRYTSSTESTIFSTTVRKNEPVDETSTTKLSTDYTSITAENYTNKIENTTFNPISSTTNTEESSVTTESSQTTTKYSVSSTPFVEKCLLIPEVNVTNIYSEAFNVSLEWEPPDSDECSFEYFIKLNDQIYNTSAFSYTIENLLACNEYNFSIWAKYETNEGTPTEKTFNTIIPSPFSYSVNILNVKEIENKVRITWEPVVEEVIQCVTHYSLTWWDKNDPESNPLYKVDPSQTFYEVDVVGCYYYVIQIYPNAGDEVNGNQVMPEYNVGPRPTEAPVIWYLKESQTAVNFTIETVDNTKNRCNITEIDITCDALPENNENFPWIIDHKNFSEEISEQRSNYRYPIFLNELSPFTNYTCYSIVVNEGGNSSETKFEFKTQEDVPSEPTQLEIVEIVSDAFTIKWKEPEMVPGIMTNYILFIKEEGPLYPLGEHCTPNILNRSYTIGAKETNFRFDEGFSFSKYTISIFGEDGAGSGREANIETNTEFDKPESAKNLKCELSLGENEEYEAVATVDFEPPCDTKGLFTNYSITIFGAREGFDDDFQTVQITETVYQIPLKAERQYLIKVSVNNEKFSSEETLATVFTPAGVPKIAKNFSNPSLKNDEIDKAYFKLPKDAFSDLNGKIVAYALILLESLENIQENFGFWNGSETSWPMPKYGSQLTPNMWMPFNNSNTDESIEWVIKPLKENSEYWLVVRAFTRAAFKDSTPLYFKTEMLDQLDLGLILGLIFGLLALLILLGSLIYLWRRQKKSEIPIEEKRQSTSLPAPIPVLKFISFYTYIKENYNIIAEQYKELEVKSKEVAGSCRFAILPENRRKNRYTNILPFDETRVCLKIEEDDEIGSDYINASYIKGYSGRIEYIATQGPIKETVRDFWKMIVQENVSMIVMVSQFIEQSKEKCYRYFPNNHESVNFGDNLEVKCSTELHFGTYCIRTLQIRKDTDQREVVHMQFLEWPDFGVPQGTSNMLQFCQELREKVSKEGGLMVVHCSAGVGRTGTLIALDIILQTIEDHRDINIYKTVLDLRKQRTNMVQTEKQFMFIYSCINDYVERPPITETDTQNERIYENMEVIKSSIKSNLIDDERESAL